jgi:hypothetical protein
MKKGKGEVVQFKSKEKRERTINGKLYANGGKKRSKVMWGANKEEGCR